MGWHCLHQIVFQCLFLNYNNFWYICLIVENFMSYCRTLKSAFKGYRLLLVKSSISWNICAFLLIFLSVQSVVHAKCWFFVLLKKYYHTILYDCVGVSMLFEMAYNSYNNTMRESRYLSLKIDRCTVSSTPRKNQFYILERSHCYVMLSRRIM